MLLGARLGIEPCSAVRFNQLESVVQDSGCRKRK
jgi:hypothetical protein